MFRDHDRSSSRTIKTSPGPLGPTRKLSVIFISMSSLIACAQPLAARPDARGYDVREKTVAVLQADLATKRITAISLVQLYLQRIRALDRDGSRALHSVLALNPHALDDAKRLDDERAAGHVRGPLHGIPVLLKDNIESADPVATTAGSLALEHNITGRDAPISARLRAAGAIILGKGNLSEWANIRSAYASSAWSAVGGLTKNPYALARNPCGSSAGSGSAVTANLVTLALGTETDGSITCPASMLGLVGLKPTLGLVSRTRVIPISSMQDSAGPMARTVRDTALLLQVIAGSDPEDPATKEASAHSADYPAALATASLAGKRFGIMKFHSGHLPQVDALFDAAVAELRAAGATTVIIEDPQVDLRALRAAEHKVLINDFREQLNTYLATTPETVSTRNLAQLIAFNQAHADRELRYFPQDLFIEAEATAGHDPAAHAQLRSNNQKTAADALQNMLTAHALDALIAPTVGPAWTTDLINGDHVLGGASTLPAVAGYPHLTVPMGQVAGLPVGLSFIGRPWSEAALLALGYAYEQRTQLRRPPLLPHDP